MKSAGTFSDFFTSISASRDGWKWFAGYGGATACEKLQLRNRSPVCVL